MECIGIQYTTYNSKIQDRNKKQFREGQHLKKIFNQKYKIIVDPLVNNQ